MADSRVSVVVVTYNAVPWIERCLESVRGHETIVVDHGSTDGTAFANKHPRAAVVGPKLLNPDGSLQRSVRGFPTLWRLATEYFFLRKLAPRTRALNAFYGAWFKHDRVREADFLMGACLLVRREAADTVGLFDEDFFMFSEETDWCYRFRQSGWSVFFTPDAEFTHVGGATTARDWGPMYREQLRGHLRFLAVHRGLTEVVRASVAAE